MKGEPKSSLWQATAQSVRPRGKRHAWCSTPFGITEVVTPTARKPGTQKGAHVLNAFRHHRGSHIPRGGTSCHRLWCSTPFGITEVVTFAVPDECDSRGQCSTPFGITEVVTTVYPCHVDAIQVLNAFRHHRGSHNLHWHYYRSLYGCSTPFGITEVVTSALSVCLLWYRSAQRLSASQR